MVFELATATRIVFGCGKIASLPSMTREFGSRALLVTGRNQERVTPLAANLAKAGIESLLFPVEGEPTLDMVRRGVQTCRKSCQFVVSVGGGSVIDAGKAIAALTPNSGEPLDYLEVIGRGQTLQNPPLPFIAVPTTAGTGAEVTRNAVLGSPEHGLKASLRSPWLLAKIALVDPELTFGLPREITANTGMDALTQVIEPYVSSRANVLTDLFCREGIQRIANSLQAAYDNGEDRAARESMAFASVLGGLSLANAGLGVVHGFAAPLGGMLHAPHGAICAALLPHAISINVRVLRERAPSDPALKKCGEVARLLTCDQQACAEDAAAWVSALSRKLGVVSLGALGLHREQIPVLVEKAQNASSMKGNPIALTPSELAELAERAL